MVTGTCLCGAVAWDLAGPIDLINHCHCTMCRRVHGSAFGTFAHAHARDFRWRRGEPTIASYESSSGTFRRFCRVCGSSVPVVEDDEVVIPAGGIDGDPGLKPSMHIFVGSKAPWYDITDDLPQFDAFPPDDQW